VLTAVFAAFVVVALLVGIPSVRHTARADATAWKDAHPGLFDPKEPAGKAPRRQAAPAREWTDTVNDACRREKDQIEALGHPVTLHQSILRFRALLVLDARYLKRFERSRPPVRYRKQVAAYLAIWRRERAVVRRAIVDLEANDVRAYMQDVRGFVDIGARAEILARRMGLPDCVTPATSK
jgi:hypothetical protein